MPSGTYTYKPEHFRENKGKQGLLWEKQPLLYQAEKLFFI